MLNNYGKKLKDNRWQRKRLEIMSRDGFECQKCHVSDHGMLAVHHRHYIPGREPWDYPGELLVTLCNNCHKQEEAIVPKVQDVLNALHFWGYFNTEIIDVLNKMIDRKIKEKPNAQQNVAGLDGK